MDVVLGDDVTRPSERFSSQIHSKRASLQQKGLVLSVLIIKHLEFDSIFFFEVCFYDKVVILSNLKLYFKCCDLKWKSFNSVKVDSLKQ